MLCHLWVCIQIFLGFRNWKLIFTEIEFWCQRLRNLQYVYEQLREPRVRSMGMILQITKSAYYSCFKNLFKNIVVALAQARDIYSHLTPLKRHITLLEEIDFSEVLPLLAPVMHIVCLIWATCESYDQVKLISLLKQICNLLVLEVIALYSIHVEWSRVPLVTCAQRLKFATSHNKMITGDARFWVKLDKAAQFSRLVLVQLKTNYQNFNCFRRYLKKILISEQNVDERCGRGKIDDK